MDILEIIKNRRSIRRFQGKSVASDAVTKILEAGRWAPSGMNNQPWRFAVVSETELKKEISKLTHYSNIVEGAHVLIAVFLNTSESYDRTKDVQAIGACLQNMLLEAHSLGLGAVWLGEIIKSNDRIRDILGLGSSLELMAVLAIGYPDEKPRAGKRKELQDLIVFRQ